MYKNKRCFSPVAPPTSDSLFGTQTQNRCIKECIAFWGGIIVLTDDHIIKKRQHGDESNIATNAILDTITSHDACLAFSVMYVT
jgi:hypothetical protein